MLCILSTSAWACCNLASTFTGSGSTIETSGDAGLVASSSTRIHFFPGGGAMALPGAVVPWGCGTTGVTKVDGSRFFFLLFFRCVVGGVIGTGAAIYGLELC